MCTRWFWPCSRWCWCRWGIRRGRPGKCTWFRCTPSGPHSTAKEWGRRSQLRPRGPAACCGASYFVNPAFLKLLISTQANKSQSPSTLPGTRHMSTRSMGSQGRTDPSVLETQAHWWLSWWGTCGSVFHSYRFSEYRKSRHTQSHQQQRKCNDHYLITSPSLIFALRLRFRLLSAQHLGLLYRLALIFCSSNGVQQQHLWLCQWTHATSLKHHSKELSECLLHRRSSVLVGCPSVCNGWWCRPFHWIKVGVPSFLWRNRKLRFLSILWANSPSTEAHPRWSQMALSFRWMKYPILDRTPLICCSPSLKDRSEPSCHLVFGPLSSVKCSCAARSSGAGESEWMLAHIVACVFCRPRCSRWSHCQSFVSRKHSIFGMKCLQSKCRWSLRFGSGWCRGSILADCQRSPCPFGLWCGKKRCGPLLTRGTRSAY